LNAHRLIQRSGGIEVTDLTAARATAMIVIIEVVETARDVAAETVVAPIARVDSRDRKQLKQASRAADRLLLRVNQKILWTAAQTD
jgi:hypothetical protein